MNRLDGYVLMTAAHNEAEHIEKTIETVIRQTTLPDLWVIVSDGSTDRTDDILKAYSERYCWLRYIRNDRRTGRDFASKVMALRRAESELPRGSYAFVGNLDADITLENDYFSRLIARFQANPMLGIGSGFVYEPSETGEFVSRRLNSEDSVPHAAQLVRKDCYEAIGGYAVLKYGGEDWHALISAKMRGWQIAAFPDLKIFHHRPNRGLSRSLKYAFRSGRMDYSFGSYLPFEMMKCFRRLGDTFGLGGIARLAGFMCGYIKLERRAVSSEFSAYLQSEQRSRVTRQLRAICKRKSEPLES